MKKVEIISKYINKLDRWFKKAGADEIITDDEYKEFKTIVDNYQIEIGIVNKDQTDDVKAQDDISIDENKLKNVMAAIQQLTIKTKKV